MESLRSLGNGFVRALYDGTSNDYRQNSVLSLAEAADLFSQRGLRTSDIQISPDGKHFFVARIKTAIRRRRSLICVPTKPVHVINFDRGWQVGDITWISNSELAISPRIKPLLTNIDVVTGDLAVFSIDGKIKMELWSKREGLKSNGYGRSHTLLRQRS